MVYLFGQILFWIALSLVVGIVLGWYIRGIVRGDAYQEMAMKEVKFERPAFSSAVKDDTGAAGVLNEALQRAQRDLEACQQSLAHAEARLQTAGRQEAPPMRRAPSQAAKAIVIEERDDLKKIYGIGPFIERKLAEIDVTTYRQIASMSEADIVRVSEYINYFPGRIERDGWLESARQLHQAKYGEEL